MIRSSLYVQFGITNKLKEKLTQHKICRMFVTSEPHYSSLVGVEASRLGRPPENILWIVLVCKGDD